MFERVGFFGFVLLGFLKILFYYMLHWICNLNSVILVSPAPFFVVSFNFLQESLFVYMCSSELV